MYVEMNITRLDMMQSGNRGLYKESARYTSSGARLPRCIGSIGRIIPSSDKTLVLLSKFLKGMGIMSTL